MKVYVKLFFLNIFSLFLGLQTLFYQMRRFYQYRSFTHSK